MRLNTISVLISAITLTLSAESISISGKVTTQSGKAITGATVKIIGQNLTATTDATGAYSIISTAVTATPAPIQPGIQKISISGSSISFNLTRPGPVRIEMFDLKGILLESYSDYPTSSGNYRFDITAHRTVEKIAIIRMEAGNNTLTFRYITPGNGMRKITSAALPASSEGTTFARTLATIDSVKVTADGYQAKSTAIASYQGVVDVTLDTSTLGKFSFFVTSLSALQELSKNTNGFGGDFRFGKTGQGAGLLGADSICECIAERSMPGSKVKQWRAFLSVAKGPDGTQVNAIDRIGTGPWYDRTGRILSNTIAELKNIRPAGADEDIINDLPNEDGVPNHRPDPSKPTTTVDNHHFVTGSKTDGTLYANATCSDWTSVATTIKARCGFSWPRNSTDAHWISGWDAPGCGVGIEITNSTGGGSSGIIGGGGGYGGFYCFALNP